MEEKTLYEKKLEELKEEAEQTMKAVKSCKRIFDLVEMLKDDYLEMRISAYSGRWAFVISANVGGFREVLPILEALDLEGFECTETVDHPSYSERQFYIEDISKKVLPAIRLNANLVETAEGTCKRILKRTVTSRVEEREYEFVCTDEV